MIRAKSIWMLFMLAAVFQATLPHARAVAQDDDPALADSTVYRVQAETYRLRLEEGIEVSYLDGGVRIDHQNAWVTGDSGKDYRARRHTVLTGNVHGHDGTMDMYGETGEYFGFTNALVIARNVRITDDGMEIVCDRARYERDSGIVVLTGNVRMSDDTRVMYADSIHYDRNLEIADATGRVVLIDQVEDYSISGRHARFFRNTKEAVVDSDPVLVFDDRSQEKGRVVSSLMHFNMEKSTGYAVGNVRMVKGETRATCDSAIIYNDEEYMELFGNPVARSGTSGMTGEKAVLHFNDEGVERVVLPRSGRLTDAPVLGSPWREDSWLQGDSLIIFLSDDEVDSVKVFGNARAMYYPYEGEENKVSNNYSSGDSMYFRFEGEDLSYVRISGNAEGVYNYVNLSIGETIDSLSATIDSSLVFRPFRENAERVVYKSKKIEYFAEVEDIVLEGKSVLDYQNKSLKAEHIKFNSRLNVLEAEGDPVLVEDEQEMFGHSMGYDMDSEGGLVEDGNTQYDTGYFRGEQIFMDGNEVLKVYNSTYTTCELERPHYSMRAQKMKIYINDKIISGPIVLYIGEIPVFYLPYLANSLRRDRHSGIIRPNFDIGINSRDGRFIRGLGYYWATNDYTDFIFKTDFNENQNFRFLVDNRYKLRYVLDGSANFNYFRNFNTNSNEWTIKGRHNQKFGRTASLNADLRFVSSDEAQSSVYSAEDVQRVIDRRIYSTASFRKSWSGTSLSLSARRDQKLNVSADNPYENRIAMTIPSLSLNLPRTSLWFGEKHPESERGGWEKALGSVNFAPNIKGDITTEESVARKKGRVTASSGAAFSQQHKLFFLNLSPRLSMGWNYSDVLYDDINEGLVVDATSAVLTGGTVTVPLSIDPSGNSLLVEVDGQPGSVVTVPDQNCFSTPDLQVLAASIESVLSAAGQQVGVQFVETAPDSGYFMLTSFGVGTATSLRLLDTPSSIYQAVGLAPGAFASGAARTGPVVDTTYKNEVNMSFSTGVGTSLYGTFYPKIGILRGVRHTFNPQVNYSYTPKLTERQVARQNVTWSIRNVLDLKYMKGGEEAKKNNAITWDMSGSYDPQGDRDSRWSSIRSAMSSSLGQMVTFRLNHTVDPYDWEVTSTNFSMNLTKDFQGSLQWDSQWESKDEKKIAAARSGTGPSQSDPQDGTTAAGESPDGQTATGEQADGMLGAGGVFGDDSYRMEGQGSEVLQGPGAGEGTGFPSWTVHTGFGYSTNYGKNISKRVSAKIDINGTLNLTENWKLRYTAYYDPEARKFTNQVYSVYRDLHCWEAEFTHSRFGDDWGFYFRIRIKDLTDIYHEVGRRGLSGLSSF